MKKCPRCGEVIHTIKAFEKSKLAGICNSCLSFSEKKIIEKEVMRYVEHRSM